MATTFDPPTPRNPAPVRAYRSAAAISDAELAQLGVHTPAQRAVFRAIKSGEVVKHEHQIARATGMNEMDTCTALMQLMSAGIVRRGQSTMNGFGGLGAFEIIERCEGRKPGAAF